MKHFTFITILLICLLGFSCNVNAKDSDGDYVILIDPGHGSIDSGTVSPITKDWEADINWDIAVALKAELQTYEGVKVYLSRGYGQYQSNFARAYTGKQLNADYNISIHNNSYSLASVNGVVCYGTIDKRYRENIEQLCRMISSNIHDLGFGYHQGGYATRSGSYNKERDYYSFLEASSIHDVPSLIIEHGFLSNYNDAMYLHQKENRYKMGEADATAIAKFLKLSKRTVAPDSEITLTRTYSAYVEGLNDASYESSNSSIVYVSEDGLITAMQPGNATITCTTAYGTSYIEVTVPEVEFKQLVAGLIQRCYRTQADAFAYNRNMVVLQAIYSDGSINQITEGFTQGSPVVAETIDANTANQMTFVDVMISYNGHQTKLKFLYFYHTPGQKNRISTPLEEAVVPLKKELTDIALAPRSFVAGQYGTSIPEIPPVEPPTQAPTQKPTEAPTIKPTETPSETPNEIPTKAPSETTSETPTKAPVETTSEPSTNAPADYTAVYIAVAILSIIAIASIIGILLSKNKHTRY